MAGPQYEPRYDKLARWRRVLSENAHCRGAGIAVVDAALAAVEEQAHRFLAAE